MKIGDFYFEDIIVGVIISKQQFDIVMRYIELVKKEVYMYILKIFVVKFLYFKVWQGNRKYVVNQIDRIILNVI